MKPEEKMFTEKEPITMLETKKELFEADIKCFKCGQNHALLGLSKHGTCTNCGQSLVEELF